MTIRDDLRLMSHEFEGICLISTWYGEVEFFALPNCQYVKSFTDKVEKYFDGDCNIRVVDADDEEDYITIQISWDTMGGKRT